MFCDIFHWDLILFEMKNIIFEISVYSKIPDLLVDEYGLQKGIPNNFNLYHINSSPGLSGIVISKEIRLKVSTHLGNSYDPGAGCIG
ncbi:TPA: hypothetical protein RG728_000748 [Morganella morganii subsp. morganii]|uniref:Uncharacterized protein n=1 Tax=Morganella morganii TaxID=582 RepID=A0AAU8ZR64_MORMO|nr:hypothetical protein [Morganella morganii]HDU8691696.1 hypothetical protein [Morganella morganii subsp. morganii]AWC95176.1 hypothetical protein AM380_16790 [Morganella morganii]EKW8484299.1 hypothetical protein [Morganella morganii]HAT3623348.1 hypothetical protein [Morganella morganii]HCU0876810.1 hypothetical protein [Morganella morganii]